MALTQPLRAVCLLVALSAVVAASASAQCADGSPPPCGARAAPAPRSLDVGLVAIVPFHVTTSDTLLGEGFAELLSSEFTGEGAPRAIDMATVLAEWRRAGGRPRAPLPRARALQLARALGAAYAAEGSVVGLGRHITITARVVDVRSGNPRGNPARVTTHADSLDAALRQVASALLASFGETRDENEGARFSSSPDAMRHYLRGLAEYRRGRMRNSALELDRAIELDSSFAQAIYRRFLTQQWSVAARVTPTLAWRHRDRLGRHERAGLELFLGTEFPAFVPMPQQLIAGERLAASHGDSPEVSFWAGDLWLHFGAVIDPLDHLRRARELMQRSFRVDSQATIVRHLVEVGLAAQDTALLREMLGVLMRSDDAGRTPYAWFTAARLGDAAALSRLRRDSAFEVSQSNFSGLGTAPGISPAAADELYAMWHRHLRNPVSRHTLASVRITELLARGRLAAADSIARETQELREQRDYALFLLGLSDAVPRLDMDSLARVLASYSPDGNPQRRCVLAQWRAQHGDTTVRWQEHLEASGCAWAIWHVQSTRSGDPRALAASDSGLRAGFERHLRGYESVFLARSWERAGDVTRALSAIRLRPFGFTVAARAPWTYPEEGRLAALAGDRAGAIRAYERYLDLTASADPVFAERRAGIQTELARLR